MDKNMKLFYKLLGYKIVKTNSFSESLGKSWDFVKDNKTILYDIVVKNSFWAYKTCK
jgi:hypothetical protein